MEHKRLHPCLFCPPIIQWATAAVRDPGDDLWMAVMLPTTFVHADGVGNLVEEFFVMGN